MPVRNESGATPRPRPGMAAPQTSRANNAGAQPVTGEDAWDVINNSKQGTDEGGFNKMNTNFYLMDGDEVNVVVLDDNPFVFTGHTIKCRTDAGKTFYTTEQCQKSIQGHCNMCASNNKAISKAKNVVAFRVLDSRGSWDKDAQGWDGEPKPKIFLAPMYLAKQFKALKDDVGGKLSEYVIKLTKNQNYVAQLALERDPNNPRALTYIYAPDFDGDLPEVGEVYAAREDDDLIDFIDRFAYEPPATQTPSNSRVRGGSGSGFGGGQGQGNPPTARRGF